MLEKPILVEMKGQAWNLFTHKVKYIDNGVESESHTSDVKWYEKFAEMHSNFKILEVVEVGYTTEQLERLEEVKAMKLADTIINNYIIDGVAGEGLEIIALQKNNAELGIEVSEREIQEIIQGQQISDLEIQILEIQLGGI